MATPIKISSAANTEITVGTTVINLRDIFETRDESTAVKNAKKFMLYVSTSAIRLFYDGNTPTSTLGVLVDAGNQISLPVTAGNIRMIRDSGASSDSVVTVQVLKTAKNSN